LCDFVTSHVATIDGGVSSPTSANDCAAQHLALDSSVRQQDIKVYGGMCPRSQVSAKQVSV